MTWKIDHSTGRPILVLNGCSVIEAEDAEYVLRLILLDQARTAFPPLDENEKDVAVAQAVDFAEYVERQAKGEMVKAARRFLSLPYSQKIKATLDSVGQHQREVGAHHPVVIRWRNDAIEACAQIVEMYAIHYPEVTFAATDIRALITPSNEQKMTPARVEESFDLISRHLVKSHCDGDGNSLFCRLGEVFQYLEKVEMDRAGWERVVVALSRRPKESKVEPS